ncbi:MAG: alkane 1-monooxygenase, partial [Sphingomonadales bacterium]|nr:alkane 1-monooxygenase [Sphingomonadales bacterium]
MRSLKYLTTHLPTLAVSISFIYGGSWSWFAVLFVFGAIPLMELVLGARGASLDESQLALDAKDRMYDYLLYMIVPIQWFFVGWYCWIMQHSEPQASWQWFGLVMAMGIMCGSFGINVA